MAALTRADVARLHYAGVAGGNHQQPEADDVRQRCTVPGMTRIFDAGRRTIGIASRRSISRGTKQTAVGRQAAAVEPGDNPFAVDR